MKEINDIIRAYETALANNQRMALATVVKVEGSSYRQPGARMLVTEDGRLTGAISGGCLEGDALRKALLAIHQQKNRLVTYDTSGEDGSEFGVQLGCNGIVHILFEPIDILNRNNSVALLERLQQNRQDAVLVTLFSTEQRNEQIGTVLLANNPDDHFTAPSNIDLSPLTADIRLAKNSRQSFLKEVFLQGIPMEALIEYRPPSVHLVIAGAGNDAKPLVEAAALVGWETTVVDGRATHATAQRFPKADQVILTTPERVQEQIDVDPLTVFVLMTHNYHYDLSLLKTLIATPTPYIGVLGPKTKMERMFNDLDGSGARVDEMQRERIFGPMGLDIGAETSEEIAISIVSEIKAILSGRKGSSLKLLTTKIHDDIPTIR
ncbi:XdhC family protein [Olivibacter sitiensis]|uniref:XdhC family protein n=1 Tax=Olivibacter sitiensis TaxID=376470 RepID=UPI0004015FB8|nr:XdhC/CoxI family protein [Olivibacter sitiensis]